MKARVALKRGILIACEDIALSSSVQATEGGSDTIGEGADAFFAGAPPPAGV